MRDRKTKDRLQTKGSRLCTLKLKGGCDTIQITAVHIPCADAPRENKDKTYEMLQEIMDEGSKRSNIHLVVGDFNARIIETTPGEQATIGSHYLKKEGSGLKVLSTSQKDNRNRFVEFAMDDAPSGLQEQETSMTHSLQISMHSETTYWHHKCGRTRSQMYLQRTKLH